MTEEKPPGHDSHYDIIRKLKPGKVILPVLIGLAVVAWFMAKETGAGNLSEIVFTGKTVFWLVMAIALVGLRTFGYMARIRTLTNNDLTWLQSFRVIILWEFTSAVTPSTVGGTAFAVIFLHKEGISTGRSTSIVLLTSFLDEMYFVIMFPVLLLMIGVDSIFIQSITSGTWLMNNLFLVALIGYVIILAWVALVGYGLFFRPAAIRDLILRTFNLPVLRKWKSAAAKAGDDIITSSQEIKNKPASFWWKSCLYTFISWTARYWIANAVIAAFFVFGDYLLIFARELVLWIIMIISPSPGGSGFAELIFKGMISDIIPVEQKNVEGVSLAMALIWRMITYYPFLLAGALVIPGWISAKFARHTDKK